jgi:glycosyltransferase involved in cell wall biosynthesis
MRIIYVHQYFRTPEQGGAIRSYYIATALASAGHEVEMVTAHNQPEYKCRVQEGFRIHYLPVRYQNRFGAVRRIYAFLQFVHLAIRRINRLASPDLMYITSTPLSTGLVGLWFRKKNIPYIFEVRDLWPEAPFQLGYFKDPVTRTLLRKLERTIYRASDGLVALSPGIARHIESVAPANSVHMIPNMADCVFFTPEATPNTAVTPDAASFSVAYTGAIGKVNGLEYLLEAAKACMDLQLRVRFHIAGDGAMYAPLKRKAKTLQLDNVRFHGHLDKNGVRALLRSCQAVYISFATLPVLSTNSPNKFFDGLAAGKICIINCTGWIQQEIEAAGCGFHTDPKNPQQFAMQLRSLMEQPEKISAMQVNARNLGCRKFSREQLTQQIVSVLETSDPGKTINTGSVYTSSC